MKAATVYAVVTGALFSASSTAPTPVYRLYQEILGLSPLTVTTIFAAYAFSLLVALLTVGSLSDFVGRRPVIFGALVLNAGAMLAFILADSTALLFLARLLQGFATGAAATTLGAAILDLDRPRGPLLNSISPFIGLTVGALVSGALVTYAPWPTQLVYFGLLVSSLLLVAPLWRLAETVDPKPGALASMRPHVTVPPQARRALVNVTPANIATWALGGFYFSLMPSLVTAATGLTSPFIGSLVVAALTSTAALSVIGLRRVLAVHTLIVGTAGLAIGVAVILTGSALGSVPLLVFGTVVAGAGFGATFSGTLQTILPLASRTERAGLLSAFYIESYLAFSLPVIACGLCIPALGLMLTAYIYGAVVIVLALTSLAMTFGSAETRTVGMRAISVPGATVQRISPRVSGQPIAHPIVPALEELLHLINRRAVGLANLPVPQRELHYVAIRRSCASAALQIGQDHAAAANTAEKIVEFTRVIVGVIEAGSAKDKSD